MTPKHRHVSDGTKVCLGSDLWDSLDPPPLSSHSRHLEDRQSNHDPSMLKPLKPYLLLNISHHRVVFSDDSISLGDLEGGSVKEKRKKPQAGCRSRRPVLEQRLLGTGCNLIP